MVGMAMTWLNPLVELFAVLLFTVPILIASYLVLFKPIVFARLVGYRADPYAAWNRFAFALLALFAILILLLEFGRLIQNF